MTRLAAELRYRAVLLGYWLRPYDAHRDARRWRWQESGCAQSRRAWRRAFPEGVRSAFHPFPTGATMSETSPETSVEVNADTAVVTTDGDAAAETPADEPAGAGSSDEESDTADSE